MGLTGPAKPVRVEPVTLPAPAREPAAPQKAPATPPPDREPVRA